MKWKLIFTPQLKDQRGIVVTLLRNTPVGDMHPLMSCYRMNEYLFHIYLFSHCRGSISHTTLQHIIDGLMRERRKSIANALNLHLSCTNPSISMCAFHTHYSLHYKSVIISCACSSSAFAVFTLTMWSPVIQQIHLCSLVFSTIITMSCWFSKSILKFLAVRSVQG